MTGTDRSLVATRHGSSFRLTDITDVTSRPFAVRQLPEEASRFDFYPLDSGGWAAISQTRQTVTPAEARQARYVQQTVQKAWRLDEDGEVKLLGEFEASWETRRNEADSAFVRRVDWIIEVGGLGFVMPEPVAMAVLHLALFPTVHEFTFDGSTWSEGVREGFVLFPLSLPIALVSGLAGAVLCLRRQRRFGARHTGMWVTVVFLLGLPGYLGWRFHRTWPALEVARLSDADIRTPEPNGIEVFA